MHLQALHEPRTAQIKETLRVPDMGMQEVLSLGNLDVTRDWGHAREYVSCMWLMLQQQQPADFVISTGTNTTVRCPMRPLCTSGLVHVAETGQRKT